MKADEVVKALRWIASNDEICFNAKQANIAADLLEQLQAENEKLKASQPVRCGECSKYHKETGWCDKHSCFTTSNGDFCHPWESNDWKMFGEDDYCSYGEGRVKE